MRRQRTKLGRIVVSVYMMSIIAALMFLFFMLNKMPFAGIYIVVLTLPWSIFDMVMIDHLGLQDSISMPVRTLLMIVYAVLNSSIFYWIGTRFERR